MGGGKHVCALKSPEFIHPVYASVFGHFVQISFLGHLPCIRWGKDSPKEKVIKQLGNGSNRGRSSRYFRIIKDRSLTQPRVGREDFLKERPLELNHEEWRGRGGAF